MLISFKYIYLNNICLMAVVGASVNLNIYIYIPLYL